MGESGNAEIEKEIPNKIKSNHQFFILQLNTVAAAVTIVVLLCCRRQIMTISDVHIYIFFKPN